MDLAHTSGASSELHRLAELHAIQTSYHDASGRYIEASDEALMAVLRSLGVDARSPADIRSRLGDAEAERWTRPIEPIIVCWEDRDVSIDLRFPERLEGDSLFCRIELENGGARRTTIRLGELPLAAAARVRGVRHTLRRLKLPRLPVGYHRLAVEIGGSRHEALVLSAPQRCWGERRRTWGVFAPLYALRSDESRATGTVRDLRNVDDWIRSLGGSVVATLPMLAPLIGERVESSPYAPSSRLFWNELYLDVEAVAEARVPRVRSVLESDEVRAEAARLREAPLVDYSAQWLLLRRMLKPMAAEFFAHGSSSRKAGFEEYLREKPDAERFATFRAAQEMHGCSWGFWPAEWREGTLTRGAFDDRVRRVYLYGQWLIDGQMSSWAAEARQQGSGLYLDFPLGVHPDGYDVWSQGSLFASNVSAGAPPDSFFTRGQDWGFPPMHPRVLQEQGFRHWIAVIRNQFERASMLRIDHVMGLHRLFWVPRGMPAHEGVYVRYPFEALYAILSIESHRSRSVVVGEDLGTVPDEVRESMDTHGVRRMYVLQYEVDPGSEPPVRPVPPGTIASVNTHDMPTFSAYLKGLDVDGRVSMGLLTPDEAAQARQYRMETRRRMAEFFQSLGRKVNEGDHHGMLEAALRFLSASDAELVLVNLEDLWQELLPQNVPGTSIERPNWRRKLRKSLETILSSREIAAALSDVNEERTGGERNG